MSNLRKVCSSDCTLEHVPCIPGCDLYGLQVVLSLEAINELIFNAYPCGGYLVFILVVDI